MGEVVSELGFLLDLDKIFVIYNMFILLCK